MTSLAFQHYDRSIDRTSFHIRDIFSGDPFNYWRMKQISNSQGNRFWRSYENRSQIGLNWVPNEISVCFDFKSPHFVIGQLKRNPIIFFMQTIRSKTVTCSHAFSRAWRQLHIFALCFEWLTDWWIWFRFNDTGLIRRSNALQTRITNTNRTNKLNEQTKFVPWMLIYVEWIIYI